MYRQVSGTMWLENSEWKKSERLAKRGSNGSEYEGPCGH